MGIAFIVADKNNSVKSFWQMFCPPMGGEVTVSYSALAAMRSDTVILLLANTRKTGRTSTT